jgi:hypothetical protein
MVGEIRVVHSVLEGGSKWTPFSSSLSKIQHSTLLHANDAQVDLSVWWPTAPASYLQLIRSTEDGIGRRVHKIGRWLFRFNLKLSPHETFQFCANDPQMLLKAAKLVEKDCDAVDINLGCPQVLFMNYHSLVSRGLQRRGTTVHF